MDWDREFTFHDFLRVYLGADRRRLDDVFEDTDVRGPNDIRGPDDRSFFRPVYAFQRPTPLLDSLCKTMSLRTPSGVEAWRPPQGFHPAQDSRLGRLLDELTSPLYAEHLLAALRKRMTPELITVLKTLPYERFLQTEYWFIVRAYVISQRGRRCERCERTGDLNVHHVQYDHRGEEVFYLEDLRLLCERCHAATHGLGPTMP